MTAWDAEKFYEENDQSEASFVIGTFPEHTDIRTWLSLGLARILHEKLNGYMFRGTVHTRHGDLDLSTEQYSALLRIQERREADQKEED